jgi:hypothetical protein
VMGHAGVPGRPASTWTDDPGSARSARRRRCRAWRSSSTCRPSGVCRAGASPREEPEIGQMVGLSTAATRPPRRSARRSINAEAPARDHIDGRSSRRRSRLMGTCRRTTGGRPTGAASSAAPRRPGRPVRVGTSTSPVGPPRSAAAHLAPADAERDRLARPVGACRTRRPSSAGGIDPTGWGTARMRCAASAFTIGAGRRARRSGTVRAVGPCHAVVTSRR